MRQAHVVYYVTFRTADSVPADLVRRWRAAVQHRAEHDESALGRHVARQIERWLDRGAGSCPLESAEAADIVAGALRYFDQQRYLLDEFAVMPNHVHVLVCPLEDYGLSQIVHSWKSFTANRVNALLGRAGPLWQDEAFDHIVRDDAALARFRTYIRSNPARSPGRHSITGQGSMQEITGI